MLNGEPFLGALSRGRVRATIRIWMGGDDKGSSSHRQGTVGLRGYCAIAQLRSGNGAYSTLMTVFPKTSFGLEMYRE